VAEPEEVARQDTEVFPESTVPDAPGARRREVERAPLIAGVLFIVLAILLLAGVDLSAGWFGHGGLLWVVLIGGGIALLVNELRRSGRRR
jgi:hypothetical protein